MIEDKFTFYKENVKKALEKYRAFANKYYQGTYKGQGKSELIERQAKPFVDGYFTLAIMGNTNAGKSTFINALVGKVDLLPTDFRQTTCVLTEIVYGEKLDIKITYGDGHIQHLTDSSKLKELVAIPEEYSDYPINTLNDWIMRGFTKEAQFIRRKDELEHIQKMPLDENVIRKYVQTHNPSNIAVKVEIKYPLPQCYQGWRIVDTPGVNALGGIEDRAKDFVNQKDFRGNSSVDAIIFIKKGTDSISDRGFKEFVDSVCNSLSQDAKKRLFLLFSFASDPQFIINEDEIKGSPFI